MNNRPDPELLNKFHQWFAIECNNHAWSLAAKIDRSEDESRDMLYEAYAAAYHWANIGGSINNARAELALAHVHALLNHGPLAKHYATRCLTFFQTNPSEDWDLAFAHAEMAYSAAILGDDELHRSHYRTAHELGSALKDDTDRSIFFEEFSRIPKP